MKQGIIKDFLNHLFPKVILDRNLKITYTFCLGGLALTAFIVLILSGVMLMLYYKPDPTKAYSSIVIIDSSVFGGSFIRTLHKRASDVFLGLIFLHTLRVVFTGAFRKPRHNNWIIGMILFCLAVCEAFCGYLLPMENKGIWAINTGLNILKKLFGNKFVYLIAPDGVLGEYTFLRFYTLHVIILPGFMLIFLFLHFYIIRKSKGILPYL